MEKGIKIQDFTKGSISKQLIDFASPLFLSNLLQMVYNMVDMAVVGNVNGKAGTSAVAVGGDVVTFLTCIAMGFAGAGQILIARYIGAGEEKRIGKFIGTMSSFLMLCAVGVSVLGVVFRQEILILMNTPAAAYEGALAYSTICASGMVFIYGYNAVSAILRGMGDSKHPFIFISVAAILNLVLDLVFVAWLRMGPGGAALATVISQAVSFIACAVFLYRNRAHFCPGLHAGDFLHWDGVMLADLVKLGIPIAIRSAAIQFSRMFVNSWVNSYGVAVSAFAGIAAKVAGVANLVSQAMNTAGSTMISQNIAAGEYERVKKVMQQIAIITITVATVCSVVVALFPTQIFGLFVEAGDTDVLEIARSYVPIAAVMFLGSALRSFTLALINGSANTLMNFAAAVLDGIVVRIGMAYFLGVVLDWKHMGFWWGDVIAGLIPFFIGMVFYYSGKWKRPAVKEI